MEKLKRYLEYKDLTATTFAKQIGCSKSHLSLILKGKALPSLKLAVKIKHLTNGQVKPEDHIQLSKYKSPSSQQPQEAINE
jgi:DNA-binding XRE family transcriptional regulator